MDISVVKRKKSANMRKIAFIGCSAKKAGFACPAKHLYRGEVFKKAWRYCTTEPFDLIFILSAKYGILSPDDVISPYNCSLNDMNKKDRQHWYDMVKVQMSGKKIMNADDIHYFFCGENYHKPFTGQKPLQGLSIGKSLAWFNVHTKTRGLL